MGFGEPATPEPHAASSHGSGPRTQGDDPRHPAATTRALAVSVAGLLGLLAVTYLRVLCWGETFGTRDHPTWTLPSRAFLGESLRRGHLPEWWDALRLGARFAGDPNHGVTYPLAWIVGILDPLLGADLLLLLHIFLAGVGALLLARRLGASALAAFFAGAVFMTAGYVTSMIVNGSILMSLGWMPLVAWTAFGLAAATQRRELLSRGLPLALVLACSVAAGNPALANNFVLAGAIVLACARRRGWALPVLLAASSLAALMGAASLLPSLATLGDSTRAGGFSLGESGAWSMHPLRLVELVWPQFLGEGLRPQHNLAWLWGHGGGALEPSWSGSVYLGLPVLFCAVVAAARGGRVPRRLGLLSLFFLLLALGTFTPVYRAYRAVFWFEHLLRYPEKHLASALLLWSTLAALGLDRLFDAKAHAAHIKAATAMALGLLLLVIAAHFGKTSLQAAVAAQSLARGIGIDARATVAAVLAGGATAAAIAFCVPLALWLSRRPRCRRWAKPALVVAVLAHLVAHDWSVHVLVPRHWFRQRPALLAGLDQPTQAEPPRLLRQAHDPTPVSVSVEARALYLHQLAAPNEATPSGFAQVPGYSISGTRRFDTLAAASGTANIERVMDLLDIRYLIISAALAPRMGMPRRSELVAGHVVLENLERRSRAFIAYRWQHGVSDAQALEQLFVPNRADVDLGAIRLAGPGNDETEAREPPTPCRVTRAYPEQVQLRCRAARAGYAVLLDEWMQGWTATLDRNPCAMERADTIFRAVAIPPGEHVVEMTYRTPGLRDGVKLAVVGWLVFLLLLGLALVRRSRPAGTTPT